MDIIYRYNVVVFVILQEVTVISLRNFYVLYLEERL